MIRSLVPENLSAGRAPGSSGGRRDRRACRQRRLRGGASRGAGAWLLLWLIVSAGGCGEEGGRPQGGSSTPPDGGQTAPTDAESAQLTVAAEPAPRPTEPLPPNASCITAECHADLLETRHLHGPVAVRQCGVCHGEEQPRHRFPLKQSINDTCHACHARMTGTHRHAPMEEPGCTSCHDPHGSDAGYLLVRANIEQLCTMCHQVQRGRHEHGPFAEGACTVCHEPHVAPGPKLLRGGGGNEHCFSCHEDLGRSIEAASLVHAPATDSCLNCHAAHSSDQPFQLASPVEDHCLSCHTDVGDQIAAMPVKHAATTEGRSCGNCHNPHAGDTAALLDGPPVDVCLSCHDQELQKPSGDKVRSLAGLKERQFLHGPIRLGECSGCHLPHAAPESGLLQFASPRTFYAPFKLDRYDLCFSCHNEALVRQPVTGHLTGFRDGARNLHYVHVHRDERGRTCKTCHEIHGSDLPNHLARSVPFAGSDWQLPINYEQTESGGSCAPGCHRPESYDRSPADAAGPQARAGGRPTASP